MATIQGRATNLVHFRELLEGHGKVAELTPGITLLNGVPVHLEKSVQGTC